MEVIAKNSKVRIVKSDNPDSNIYKGHLATVLEYSHVKEKYKLKVDTNSDILLVKEDAIIKTT